MKSRGGGGAWLGGPPMMETPLGRRFGVPAFPPSQGPPSFPPAQGPFPPNQGNFPAIMPPGGLPPPHFPHFPNHGMMQPFGGGGMGMGGGLGGGGGLPMDANGLPLVNAMIDLERGTVWRQQWTQHSIADLVGGKKSAIRAWKTPVVGGSPSTSSHSSSGGGKPLPRRVAEIKRELGGPPSAGSQEDALASDCEEVLIVTSGDSQRRWLCQECQGRDEAIAFTAAARVRRHAAAHLEAGPDLPTRLRRCFPSFPHDEASRETPNKTPPTELPASPPVAPPAPPAPAPVEPVPVAVTPSPAKAASPPPPPPSPPPPPPPEKSPPVEADPGAAVISRLIEAHEKAGTATLECRFEGGCSKAFSRPVADCQSGTARNRLRTHVLVTHFRSPYLVCGHCGEATARIKAHMGAKHPACDPQTYTTRLGDFLTDFEAAVDAAFPVPKAPKRRKTPSPLPPPPEEEPPAKKKPGRKPKPAPTPPAAKSSPKETAEETGRLRKEYEGLLSAALKASAVEGRGVYCGHTTCCKELKATRPSLDAHIGSHADIKAWRCGVCQKYSSQKGTHAKKCGSGSMTDSRKAKAFNKLIAVAQDCLGGARQTESPLSAKSNASLQIEELASEDESAPRPASAEPRKAMASEPPTLLLDMALQMAEETRAEGITPHCRLCDEDVGGSVLADHLSQHWTGKTRLFGCRLCGGSVDNMAGHLSERHPGVTSGDWADLRGRSQTSLVRLFASCFPDDVTERKVLVRLD